MDKFYTQINVNISKYTASYMKVMYWHEISNKDNHWIDTMHFKMCHFNSIYIYVRVKFCDFIQDDVWAECLLEHVKETGLFLSMYTSVYALGIKKHKFTSCHSSAHQLGQKHFSNFVLIISPYLQPLNLGLLLTAIMSGRH